MVKSIRLLIILHFLLLLGCASRGWQLSEQIQGYNNKLQAVSECASAQSGIEERKPTSQNTQGQYMDGKFFFKGQLVRTTFGEPGWLLGRE